MKAAVISQGSVSSKWIYEAMQKYFDKVDFLNLKDFEVIIDSSEPKILYDGEELGDYDCVYVRGSFKYAKLLRSLSSVLELRGTYVPLNSRIFTVAHDKLLTHLYLQRAGVPMPKTYMISSIDASKQLLKKIKYPIVMKFPEGTHGKGVMFSESYASASALIDAFTALKQPFILQEFIDADGEDYRAIVVGDEVVASMKRISASGEQRSNFHAGGTCVPEQLPEDFKRAAISAAKAMSADIIAVDLMATYKGPVVIEVNSSPGLQGITAATKIDIADKIARYLAQATVEKKELDKSELIDNLIIRDETKRLTTNLKLRGGRLVLPEFVTNITSFREDEELIFEAKKGKLTIERI